MIGRMEELAARYSSHIGAPWQRNISGDQKAIFVVYAKSDERRLRLRMPQFKLETEKHGHSWHLLDLTGCFAQWMAAAAYREVYFSEPGDLSIKLNSEFVKYVSDFLRRKLTEDGVDDNTVVAVNGLASLFGFARVSLVLKEAAADIRGRLMVFFPGEYENHNYRLLDARDGWNYLAVPITLHNGESDA